MGLWAGRGPRDWSLFIRAFMVGKHSVAHHGSQLLGTGKVLRDMCPSVCSRQNTG
jgi:hypothetical protein